ncbi:hypothetical protein PG996_006491 [Apiospora saccharicola]|uniref:Uncharacterized protein n=1 Tax=Apiospora saccharicola TaxID=335842 RepID=A0ABR1VTI6_9PEZI
MASNAPIPVLLCGKIPGHIQATTEIMKPEFEIVEVCSSLEAARTAVNERLSPSSALPTEKKPRVVLMGGGFTQDDFASVYESVEGAKSVPWVRPAIMKPGAEDKAAIAKGPPSAEDVASRIRKLLEEHLGELREGKGEGEIWWM